MTVLNEGEILTAVRLPNEWANAEFYFEKVADRECMGLCPSKCCCSD
jgi:xanthine dehydrogenase YagS FAD-binding subunit